MNESKADSNDMLYIVLSCQGPLWGNSQDHRHHLMYASISRLSAIYNQDYHLYIVGDISDTIKTIVDNYINTDHVTYSDNYDVIMNNPAIECVLHLDYYDVICDGSNLRNSKHYVPKHPILDQTEHTTPILDIFTVDYEPVMRVVHALTGKILVHSNFLNYSYPEAIKDNSVVGVSCVMVLRDEAYVDIVRSLRCYEQQCHANKELVIVHATEPTMEVINALEKVPGHYIIVLNDGAIADMRNSGVKACTKDYVLRWNATSWYHPAFLGMLTCSSDNNNMDYINSGRIIGHSGSRFFISYLRPNGWEQVLMVNRSRFLEYPSCSNHDTVHLASQHHLCSTIELTPESVMYLHVDVHSPDHPLSISIDSRISDYYQEKMFKPEPTPPNVCRELIVQPSVIVDTSLFTKNWIVASFKNIFNAVTAYFYGVL